MEKVTIRNESQVRATVNARTALTTTRSTERSDQLSRKHGAALWQWRTPPQHARVRPEGKREMKWVRMRAGVGVRERAV